MKIFLDDMRDPPSKGWTTIRTCESFMALVMVMMKKDESEADAISFDHDLGTERTGYDAMVFLEELAFQGKFKCLDVRVHTANASARPKMEMTAENIVRFSEK